MSASGAAIACGRAAAQSGALARRNIPSTTIADAYPHRSEEQSMNQQRSFIQAAVAALALAAALPAFAETRLEVQTVRHPYVYYRDHDIYYSPETRTWFWRADGTWLSGPALPRESEVYVKAGGIKVELDTERPYERHDYVVTHYRNAPAPVTERTVTESSPDRQVTTERTVTETVPGRTEERTVSTTTT
jgi:hypothetical protein